MNIYNDIYLQPHHTVFKKSFKLLVATKTIPFFVVVPILSDHRCRSINKFICEPHILMPSIGKK